MCMYEGIISMVISNGQSTYSDLCTIVNRRDIVQENDNWMTGLFFLIEKNFIQDLLNIVTTFLAPPSCKINYIF